MKLSRRQMAVWMALPALIYVFLFVLPLVGTARMSFNTFVPGTGTVEDLSLAQYREVLSSSHYMHVWRTTVKLSVLAAALTSLLGMGISYFLWRSAGRWRTVLTGAILAPLLTSGVVRAYGWIVTTGPSGFVPDVTEFLGLGRFTAMFNETAVLLGLVHVFLPYSVLLILGALDTIDDSIMRASANLGSNPWVTFRRVVLPLAFPGVFASILLTFALSSAAYSIPAILGGRRVVVAARAIFTEQTFSLNRPLAAALSVILVVITVAAMLGYQLMTRRQRARLET